MNIKVYTFEDLEPFKDFYSHSLKSENMSFYENPVSLFAGFSYTEDDCIFIYRIALSLIKKEEDLFFKIKNLEPLE